MMKIILIIVKWGANISILLITLFFFFPYESSAQSWEWAKGGVGTANIEVHGISNQGVTTDLFGNVYGIAFSEIGPPLFAIIGTDTIHKGVVIVKHNSNNGNIIWVKNNFKNITTDCLSMVTDPSGNLYVTGQFYDTAILDSYILHAYGGTGYDLFLAKLDSSGNVLWAKSAGGTASDNSKSITIDPIGNIYITGGSTSHSIIFDTDTIYNNSNNISYIAKYNGITGNVIWTKPIVADSPIISSTQVRSCNITVDKSSNILVTGDYFHSNLISFKNDTVNSPGSIGFFLMKIDSLGNLKWLKVNRNFIYTHVQTDLSRNIFITGEFSVNDALDGISLNLFGTQDVFIAKCDSTGNVIWAKNAGIPGISMTENGLGLDDSGRVYMITGYYGLDTSLHLHIGTSIFSVNNPLDPVYIIKLDTSGKTLCGMSISCGGDDYIGMSIDKFSGIYVCGDYKDSCRFGPDLITDSSNNENYFMAKLLMPCSNQNEGILNASINNFMTVYPNPVSDQINVCNSTIINKLEIYNVLGQRIYYSDYCCNKTQINVNNLSAGMYFLKVNGNEVRIFCKN